MHYLELQWIEWIHQFRTPMGDVFFHFFRFFDRPEFSFVLLPLIWLNYGMKNGMRIFYILFFNTTLNSILKAVFALPRPCDLNPNLGLFPISNYGFPSGAAQTTILLSGLLFCYLKTPWKWAIILPYILLVSFSRIYLGVHFPSDILGGWFFGFLLLLAVLHFLPRIEKSLTSLNFLQKIALHLVFTLTLLSFLPIYFKTGYVASSIGLALGLVLAHYFKVSLPIYHGMKQFFLRSLIGIGGVFGLFYLLPIPFLFQIFFMSLWICFFAPLICRLKPFRP